jgi:phosphoribosyl 1,2-cyclic phosphodiesterase
MVDCGTDWRGLLEALSPTAIVLTHAHSDHAWGLANGAPCPVHATRATRALLSHYPVEEWCSVRPREPFRISGIQFEAFPVEHSLRAPAVGYRVSAGGAGFFYVPDVLKIRAKRAALRNVDLFIGDGAVVARSLVRRVGNTLIGHASVREQLGWCGKERVPRAIFTHCGSGIVKGHARHFDALVRRLGCEHGVDARIARDGLKLQL